MKVLTATTQTQGQRGNDFSWCVDGEVVILGSVCDRSQLDPDDLCGCGRAFSGLSSCKATTTAVVREIPGYGFPDLVTAVRGYLETAGWDWDAIDVAREVAELAAGYPADTVLERRLDEVSARDGQ